jgi:hypothetical protein
MVSAIISYQCSQRELMRRACIIRNPHLQKGRQGPGDFIKRLGPSVLDPLASPRWTTKQAAEELSFLPAFSVFKIP